MNTQQAKTQIIAHDKEVYDIGEERGEGGRERGPRRLQWCSSTTFNSNPSPFSFPPAFARGKDLFASVGADGSVRMFDLRSLVHSTIIYESPELTPLLRLAWNKQDPNYLAAIMADSAKTFLLDIRKPSSTVAELGEHQGPVNSLAWAPHSACHICTCGEDRQALIWDLTALPGPVDSPILAYAAQAEVNTVEWFQQSAERNWVAIGFDNQLQVLRV